MTDFKPSKFCQSCGNQLAATSAFCPNCGTSVGVAPSAPTPTSNQGQAIGVASKSKTTAVVLAVFFGFWSWLYTFKVNKIKFFIGLGVSFVASMVQISSLIFNLESLDYYVACLDDAIYYGATSIEAVEECALYQPDYSSIFLASSITFGIWLWALIDNARKSANFYSGYPNAS
ncbi:MAG: zinc-ribbon domain [Actinomycetota bacterium]|jgi:hypothetical protein